MRMTLNFPGTADGLVVVIMPRLRRGCIRLLTLPMMTLRTAVASGVELADGFEDEPVGLPGVAFMLDEDTAPRPSFGERFEWRTLAAQDVRVTPADGDAAAWSSRTLAPPSSERARPWTWA